MNFSATKTEGSMREWVADTAAALGLLVFIASAFLLSQIAPVIFHNA